MNVLKKWFPGMAACAACLMIATVSMAATVRYDYDREVDFSKWKIAAWRPSGPMELSMEERRIRKALEDGFKAKGFVVVDTPLVADFLIDYRGAAWRDTQVSDTFRGPGFGRQLHVERVPVGVLMVEVIDRKTGRVAWHGSVSDELAKSPEKADKKTAKNVAKLLENFPPKKG